MKDSRAERRFVERDGLSGPVNPQLRLDARHGGQLNHLHAECRHYHPEPAVDRRDEADQPRLPTGQHARLLAHGTEMAELHAAQKDSVIITVLQVPLRPPAGAFDQGGHLPGGNVVLRPLGRDQVPVADPQHYLGWAIGGH